MGAFLKWKTRLALNGLFRTSKHRSTDRFTNVYASKFQVDVSNCSQHNRGLFHVDLKTAFLQGESYELSRNVIFQLAPVAIRVDYIGARLKRPAYALNDAPLRWWNRLDTSLRSYGMFPTRADRCCYVY